MTILASAITITLFVSGSTSIQPTMNKQLGNAQPKATLMICDDPHGPDPHGSDPHDPVTDKGLPANSAKLPANQDNDTVANYQQFRDDLKNGRR